MYKQLRLLTTLLLLAVCGGVWATESWVKTAIADLKTNDVVVIVDETSSMALPNNGGTSTAPSAISVTLSSDKSEITSTVATTLRWEVEVLTNTYRFGVLDADHPFNNCLYCTNSNNGVRVGTNTSNQFTWDASTKKLKNVTTSRWVGVYDEQDWRCYTNTTGNIATTVTSFYKLVEVEASPLVSIALSGTYPTLFKQGEEFSHEGMVVTATYEDSSTKNVTSSASFSGYDMSSTGAQTVTVSYTEGEVTKTATYDINVEALPTHTVTFSVNGQETTQDFAEGAAITFPTVEDIDGYSVIGWTSSEIDGVQDTAPEMVTSATMGSENMKYYAVLANVIPGSLTTITDKLTRETTEASGTTYSDWEGKTGESGAVYAGQSAGSNSSIQLRSDKSSSGIITTTSGGKVTKVTVEWETHTSNGRTLDVYGSNTAYTAASELYNSSKQGTKLGSIVYGTSTELTITGDYAYVGLRSNSGAMYLTSVSIEWQTGTPATYSNYCTTIPVYTATITLNAACTDGEMVYGTFSCTSPFVASDDIIVAEVGVLDGELLVEEYKAGDVVPANTGVMVSALEGGDYTVTLSSAAGTSKLGEDNSLRPTGDEGITAEAMAVADAKCEYYRLTMHNGTQIGYWWGAENGAAFALAANKAYLAVPESLAKNLGFGFGQDADATEIVLNALGHQAAPRYNMQGQRVADGYKGIVIVNGKKYMNK